MRLETILQRVAAKGWARCEINRGGLKPDPSEQKSAQADWPAGLPPMIGGVYPVPAVGIGNINRTTDDPDECKAEMRSIPDHYEKSR